MFLKKNNFHFKFFFSLLFFIPQVCLSEAPYLEIKENSFDFGRVDEGSIVEHSFVVRNSGNADLRIEKVVTGCDCLEENYSDILIFPNEEKEFRLKIDTSGLGGVYEKKIRFFANEEGHSFSSFLLKGYVNPLIKVEPAVLDFVEITGGSDSSKTKTLKIFANKQKSIKILKVESFSKAIQVQELGGDEYEKTYEVKLSGQLPLGEYRERVIASFSNGKSINIPIIVVVHNIIELEPKVVSFGDLSGKRNPVKKVVSVINWSAGECRITDIDSSSSLIDADLQDNNKNQVISVQIDPMDLKRPVNEKLFLETDCEQQSNIVLGVHAFYKKKAK